MQGQWYLIFFRLHRIANAGNNVLFSYYFREVSELVVSIIQARDLTANQYTGTLDTYIRGIILPDSDSKFQTKVKTFFKNNSPQRE